MTSDRSSGAEAGLAAGDARSATQRPEIDSYVNLPRPAVDQTASLCRQLLTALQFLQLAGGADQSGNVDEASQTDSRKNPDVTERLRAENEHLRNKMKELVEMNVSWQKMHAEREKYVAELNRRLEMTESTLPTDDVEQLQQRCSRLEEENDMLRAERDGLRSRLSDSESLVERLRSDVDSLETAAGDRQSTIEMLQMQVVIYREDFECERKDRERAQGQVVELTNKIDQMNRSRQQAEHRMPSTYPGDYNVHSSSVHPSHLNHYHRHNNNSSSVVTPAANDIYFIGRGDVYQIDGKDADDLATDGPEDDDAAAAAAASATGPQDADVLQCPKCLRGFTKDQHVELMDHIDACV